MTRSILTAALWTAALTIAGPPVTAAGPPVTATGATSNEGAAPESLTVEIRNRMYPEYFEVITLPMNTKHQVGDTDYFFEVVDFYPHFAIIDSTKEIVSLSDELKNPAFKINVYENEELLEGAWAFFEINIPHFTRESFLYFRVVEFEYRGEVHGSGGKEEKP